MKAINQIKTHAFAPKFVYVNLKVMADYEFDIKYQARAM